MLSHPALDLDFTRRQFPEQHFKWAFFENAGGAFVPNQVIARMASYMTDSQVQPGYPYPASEDAAARINQGHQLMAEFIGADRDEITIGPSTSINVYVLAHALRGLWSAGDEIIVSTANHEANSGPWRRLVEFGFRIVEWPVNRETAALQVSDLEALLNDRTRLVAFPHVSNITGDINDVKTITTMAHAVGAMVCVDGVAYAPHRLVEVKDWDVDFYLYSFYKVFGPHLGCLYGKRERLLEAQGQSHYFFPEDDLLHKLNPSGPNHESMASLVGIADYYDAIFTHHSDKPVASFRQRVHDVYRLIANHEEILATRFLEYLESRPNIRLIGTPRKQAQERVPTFSFQIEGRAAAEAPGLLARDNIAASAGHFYAKRLLDSLALDSKEVVRCSMAHYNTITEVMRLIDALERLNPARVGRTKG